MNTVDRIAVLKEWQAFNPLKKWRNEQMPRIGIHTAAAMIGVTPSTVQTWEGGMYSPRLEHLVKLGEVMGDSNLTKTWKAWEDQRPATF